MLGISINHPFSQKAFSSSLNLQYPLLSDYPDAQTVRAYGVDYHEGQSKQLFARPSFFLVDKAGTIQGYWGQRPPNPADEVWAPDPLFSSSPILERARALLKAQ